MACLCAVNRRFVYIHRDEPPGRHCGIGEEGGGGEHWPNIDRPRFYLLLLIPLSKLD